MSVQDYNVGDKVIFTEKSGLIWNAHVILVERNSDLSASQNAADITIEFDMPAPAGAWSQIGPNGYPTTKIVDTTMLKKASGGRRRKSHKTRHRKSRRRHGRKTRRSRK